VGWGGENSSSKAFGISFADRPKAKTICKMKKKYKDTRKYKKCQKAQVYKKVSASNVSLRREWVGFTTCIICLDAVIKTCLVRMSHARRDQRVYFRVNLENYS
jgi:hypothetical protein